MQALATVVSCRRLWRGLRQQCPPGQEMKACLSTSAASSILRAIMSHGQTKKLLLQAIGFRSTSLKQIRLMNIRDESPLTMRGCVRPRKIRFAGPQKNWDGNLKSLRRRPANLVTKAKGCAWFTPRPPPPAPLPAPQPSPVPALAKSPAHARRG